MRKMPAESEERAAGIYGLGVAAPKRVEQSFLAEMAEGLCCANAEQRHLLHRLFLRTGVSTRGSVLACGEPVTMETARAFYPLRREVPEGPGTAARMVRYAAEAPGLGEQAACAALAEARCEPRMVTHLITVSCTGFVAPGLDVALIGRLGLRPEVQRLHIGFMGCHAAFNALAAARDAVGAHAKAVALVCCVELCSLHFTYGWNPDALVAASLFADGAAAAVVRGIPPASGDARPPGVAAESEPVWRLVQTASRLLPESLNAMTWRIGDHGFEMTLSAEVPGLIARWLRPWCEEWLGRRGMAISDIRHWAIHPGGPRIVSEAGKALGLSEEALGCSRRILEAYGNMSSATILFLLRQMADEGRRGLCGAIGFGPGLMAEGMVVER